MKVLVTGGAGFIGSHLCERLLADGHDVVCVDNLGSGSKGNVKHLLKNKRFKFLKRDVRKVFSVGKVDRVYHLASRASPKDFSLFPVEIAMTNSLGTYNLLEMARKKKARILFASTSEVYGDPKEHPQREGYWGNVNPNGPRSCYDESKRVGEAICFAHNREFGTEIRVIRIFNTYGPRMRKDDGRLVPNLITQALAGRKLTVYGQGVQTRSFCYVDDLVDGIVRAMEGKVEGPVNLGNPKEYSILQVAEMVKGIVGKGEVQFRELPKDDPTRRQPDISLARERLGWEPKVGFEEGLKRTIEWFKN